MIQNVPLPFPHPKHKKHEVIYTYTYTYTIQHLTLQTQTQSHTPRIPTPQPHPPPPLHPPLPGLIHPKNRTRQRDQDQQISKPQALGLKHLLQEREVDNAELSHQAAGNGIIEHFVPEQFEVAEEDGFGFGAAGERVEHVEEDEGGEGHGCVAAGDEFGFGGGEGVGGGFVVDGAEGGHVVGRVWGRRGFVDHLVDVDGEGAEHDKCCGGEDAPEEGSGEDAGGSGAGWEVHDAWVDGFDAERLCGWTVHEDIWTGTSLERI